MILLWPGLNEYFTNVFSKFPLYSIDKEIDQSSHFQVSVFIKIRYIMELIFMSTLLGFFCGPIMPHACTRFLPAQFTWLSGCHVTGIESVGLWE